ncbi:DUF3365 domain-containing protein [Shewanella livingstonensis]|uniref:DUF3365 domain-containing protein n=1 Tax=Shewanella livingstonensis TaxID=150120 RepID=A0A3G8LUB4_9GAMM|nr:DUF3365 domain-containing protein [Shewanella livingstonensis]AZG73373.1 DUF3365 domain-containing protein [Shewanella livingstonensis]
MRLIHTQTKSLTKSSQMTGLIMLISVSTIGQAETITEQQILEQQANQRIGEFSQALKGQLQAAIKQGGLMNAVTVCQSVAPAIAAQHSKDGWTLTRTSLRVRNAGNSPDAWELAQLQKFEQMNVAINQAGQQTNKPIVASAYIVNGNNTAFRYMKAIPTQELCLGCHGSNINLELSALIHKTYPNDNAINFALGDIRGAFSLQKVIAEPAPSITAKP